MHVLAPMVDPTILVITAPDISKQENDYLSILEDNWYADVLVYPLVFTYRHAIELGIKHLGSMIPKIYDDKSKIKFTHDLEDNWKTVRTYLERDKNFGGRDLVKQINKILRDFLHIDPTGEAFRYPIARVGSAFLQDTSIINIEIFAKTMIYVAETFEYWFDMVDEYWVAKCEVEHHS